MFQRGPTRAGLVPLQIVIQSYPLPASDKLYLITRNNKLLSSKGSCAQMLLVVGSTGHVTLVSQRLGALMSPGSSASARHDILSFYQKLGERTKDYNLCSNKVGTIIPEKHKFRLHTLSEAFVVSALACQVKWSSFTSRLEEEHQVGAGFCKNRFYTLYIGRFECEKIKSLVYQFVCLLLINCRKI